MEKSVQPITNEERDQVLALRAEYKRVSEIYNKVDEGVISAKEGLEEAQLKNSQLEYKFIKDQLDQYLNAMIKNNFIEDEKEKLLNYFAQVQRYFLDMVDLLND